ncbi:protein CHUP1, chloroplastic [Cinnamomum micranthum f. kanehirae]|uniref:Protein CHUP1, chloroplastic n=1 Tax=Cinnamomum micranthum f. kanehirae TaxID=337451 RepID=A0A3S3NSY5_9MAGN|nr:protein CHUP1, chloroplastic [Cinnamomum micranthum f. kanehirae]
MKEEIASANKATPPPARLRAASKIKDSPRPEDGNGASPGPKARTRSVVAETNNIQRARRSLGMNRLKAGEDTTAQKGREMEERRLVGRPGNRAVEQFARLPRRLDHSSKRIEDEPDAKREELQQKLDMSENLVQELQSEISVLKSQVEKLQSLNSELESQNRRFKEDLATAEAKISTFQLVIRRNQLWLKYNPLNLEMYRNSLQADWSILK